MKKITIGRHISNNVVIPDDQVLVSRKHAVITVSFFGKMRIYDTSTGGTSVNGQPVDKGMGTVVTRKDEVKLNTVALDWTRVTDPYRKWRMILLLLLLLCAIAAGVMAYMYGGQSSAKTTDNDNATEETISPKDDADNTADTKTATETPAPEAEIPAPAPTEPKAVAPAETKPAPAAPKTSAPKQTSAKPAPVKTEPAKPAAPAPKPAPQSEKKIEVESYD